MVLTKNFSQLGNMVVVHVILLQVDEFTSTMAGSSPLESAKAVQRTINHSHHPTSPDSHAVPLPRNHTSCNNLCTLCLLLWRFDEIDRDRPRVADLHGNPITATQYSKPMSSRRTTFVTSRMPTPCHVSRTAHIIIHFRSFFFCTGIKCCIRSRRLHF